MEIGAIFPQTELSADPGAIREFVQAVEAMGYANLFVADHVLGADTRFHHHPSTQMRLDRRSAVWAVLGTSISVPVVWWLLGRTEKRTERQQAFRRSLLENCAMVSLAYDLVADFFRIVRARAIDDRRRRAVEDQDPRGWDQLADVEDRRDRHGSRCVLTRFRAPAAPARRRTKQHHRQLAGGAESGY